MNVILCRIFAVITSTAALSLTPHVLPEPVDLPAASKPAKPVDEAASLTGRWVPVSAEHGGEMINPADDNWHCVIEGDKITHYRNDRVHVSGVMLMQPPGDAGQRMYWKYSTHPVTDSVIYHRMSDDVLITCWSGEWAKVPPWPLAFVTGVPTRGKYMVVWRRERKALQQ